MLSIHHLNKSYGIQPILQNVTFNISNRERIGLIGPNGSGKTTLMKILAGIEQPDSGTVSSTRLNLRIGYLAQGMDFTPGQTLQTALGIDPVSEADRTACSMNRLTISTSKCSNGLKIGFPASRAQR